jgi:hypothetical protein
MYIPSDEERHLYMPNQKAVISWDGLNEEMIISSSVRLDNLTNMAWIIPIQSKNTPKVEAGNISVFEDLVSYFKEPPKKGFDGFGFLATGGASGIDVIYSIPVDIYDVTVLKANNADDLINWLNQNNYSTPDDAKPLFEKYVGKGDMYFVANRIDLKNKHAKELGLLDEALKNASARARLSREKVYDKVKPVYDRLGCDLVKNYSKEEYLYWERVDCTLKLITDRLDAEQIEYSLKQGYSSEPVLVFKDGYTASYEYGGRGYPLHYIIDIKGHNLLDGYYELYYTYEQRDEGPFEYTGVKPPKKYANLIKQVIKEHENDLNEVNYPIYEDAEYELLEKKINAGDFSFVCLENYKRYVPMSSPYTKIDYQKYLEYNGEDFVALCKTQRSIATNMATPLKIKFQPPFPYYPLEISSLGNGQSIIELYILSDQPVTDLNKVMNDTKNKKVDASLKEKLDNYVSVGNKEFVTRLSWKGDINTIKADVKLGEPQPSDKERKDSKSEIKSSEIYSEADDRGIFEKIWDWITNIF